MMDTMKTHIIVNHNGDNSWLAPIVFNQGCGMNVADFPFDVQTCPMLFRSVTYDTSKVNSTSSLIGRIYTRDELVNPTTLYASGPEVQDLCLQ